MFGEPQREKRVVLYARVSFGENKSDLDNQLSRLEAYAISKGYTIVKYIKEVDGGLNNNCVKVNDLLEDNLNPFDILIVDHEDRLISFSFNYLVSFLQSYNNKSIEVIDLVENHKEDLIQDFVSITVSYARVFSKLSQ